MGAPNFVVEIDNAGRPILQYGSVLWEQTLLPEGLDEGKRLIAHVYGSVACLEEANNALLHRWQICAFVHVFKIGLWHQFWFQKII